MAAYLLSQQAKDDLIQIHRYGVERFGVAQADRYFSTFFEYFDIIAANPYSFDAVDFIKPGYKRCVCGSDTIYYRIGSGSVEIMTIIGKQDFKP